MIEVRERSLFRPFEMLVAGHTSSIFASLNTQGIARRSIASFSGVTAYPLAVRNSAGSKCRAPLPST